MREFDFENCIAILNVISIPFGIGAISSPSLNTVASKIKHIIVSLVIISLLILSNISTFKWENETRARKLLILFKGYRTMWTVLTILQSFYNNRNFRKTVNKIKEMNSKLVSSGQPLNYKLIAATLFAMYVFLLVFSSLQFSLTLFDIMDKPTRYIFSRIFFECYQVMFGLLFIIYFNFFCIIFTFAFMKIKKMLNNIRYQAIEEECSPISIKLLLAVSRIYEDIFYGIKSFNRMVAMPLLTLVINNTLDALVIVTIIYNKEEKKMDYLNLCVIAAFYILVILPAIIVTQLSEQLCNILGECNICYTDTKMSLTKNTFLLQLCHQKINFSISKILSLSTNTLIDIFTLGTTIVIFLFQLAHTW